MSILLSFIPWWGRVLVVIALCTALFGAGYIKGVSSESAKFDAYKLSQAQQTIEIQAATIAKQTAMQRKKDEALNEAQKRTQVAQENLASARLSVNGLLDDLADSNRKLSSASIESLRSRVAALSDVFGKCTKEYSELAGTTDRLAIERDTLINAWPK